MSLYRSSHFIDSLTVALQYASVYHPPEFQGHLKRVHACEESAIAREAMEQILTSARWPRWRAEPSAKTRGQLISVSA
jgi:tartrate dehydratase alpha subunit/fumarate hydratase class I-like protein